MKIFFGYEIIIAYPIEKIENSAINFPDLVKHVNPSINNLPSAAARLSW